MKKDDIITLPELADATRLSTPHFRVVDIISGGMGTCLKLRHAENEAAYAVKLIRPELMDNDLAWHRFYEELKLCFTLSESSGVVEAICLARLNEIPCLCSPWMKGGTLRNKMNAGNCSPEFVFRTLARVVNTLAWVDKNHKAVHRDLKPENILLDENGLAYVSDWGLAKLVDKQLRQIPDKITPDGINTRPDATQPDSFLGTIFYASPEQILGQKGIDLRSDIYSLGCIMYELESGKPPFTGRTVGEIATHHLRDKAPELGGGFFRRTKYGLENIIERCLLKNPKDRFQNYSELIEEIICLGKKRRINFNNTCPNTRPYRPIIGIGEYKERILAQNLKPGAKYRAVKLDDIEPYLAEIDALTALGQWKEAEEIIKSLYNPELVKADKKWNVYHTITVNYALCLIKLGNAARAVDILEPLAGMINHDATYYVNYSLALLHTHAFAIAEQVCKKGLSRYPSDSDIIGNYLIALTFQNKLSDAMRILDVRLQQKRDVHSLEEAAGLMMRLADEYGERDWKQSTTYVKKALGFLQEAKQQNPRFLSARYTLAVSLFHLEQYEAAAKEFMAVASLAGKNSVLTDFALGQVARVMHSTGEYKECVIFCRKWILESAEFSVHGQVVRFLLWTCS